MTLFWGVFFGPTGDLEKRAVIREPATLLITNATRSDTAKYRCEVTAADDQKSFDEIVIDLVVRGTLSHLDSCRSKISGHCPPIHLLPRWRSGHCSILKREV